MATIGFPVMFYLLFGLSFGNRAGGPKASEYLLAGYAIFGMITAALFAFGAGVATERASGWLLLKQAAPLPTWRLPHRQGADLHALRPRHPRAARRSLA